MSHPCVSQFCVTVTKYHRGPTSVEGRIVLAHSLEDFILWPDIGWPSVLCLWEAKHHDGNIILLPSWQRERKGTPSDVTSSH